MDIAQAVPDLPAPDAPGAWRAEVVRVRDGAVQVDAQTDVLAEETPVALEYNGIAHATLMATPADLEDFAIGFSLTEGIVRGPGDVRDVEICVQPQGVVVRLEIASACLDALKRRRRAMAGRTGCGLCGVETLDDALRPIDPVPDAVPVPLPLLLAGMAAMRGRQALHAQTGATHAAAWMDARGRLRLLREDVGRHNALDKLLGAMARQGLPAREGAVLVSSRASYEMVQKAASLGAGVLAAVSAPTALALRVADRANVALVGFVRGRDCAIYTHPERIAAQPRST